MVEVNFERKYQGIGIGHGVCCGRLFFYPDRLKKADADGSQPFLGAEEEQKRLREALGTAGEQLRMLFEETRQSLGEQQAEIFEIHGMLLADEDFVDAMLSEIRRGQTASEAVKIAVETFSGQFAAMEDAYMAGRAADVRDVGERVLAILSGEGRTELSGSARTEPEGNEPYIVVAGDLTPSQTVTLDRLRVLGFVTMEGTPTSHAAILARAMGLPALVGVGEIWESGDGKMAILDAGEGTLTVGPGEALLRAYEAKERAVREREAALAAERELPAVTRSGHRVRLFANIGGVEEWRRAMALGAEGVGLFRSESLFLEAAEAPDEEAQFSVYRQVAEAAEGRPVIIRTLDVGADKQVSYLNLPREENPALGVRAIRLCLARPELFRVQLRAILRASAFGKVAIMLPMVVSAQEIRQARALMELEMAALDQDGIAFDHDIGFGIMIETPAAVMMSDELAPLCDFFSVGTNDLTQYTLAADRQNPALEALCRHNTEPVLRLIEMAAAHIHRCGGWIGICGELAAEPELTQRFCDMRLDELSVAGGELPELKARIREAR